MLEARGAAMGLKIVLAILGPFASLFKINLSVAKKERKGLLEFWMRLNSIYRLIWGPADLSVLIW